MNTVKLSRDDLYSLEKYSEMRSDFRARVLAHKKHRHVTIGPVATLYFEDRLTMQYQIQEMLRVERIFEPEGIQDELDAYNPLIPDGSIWKATMMIEFQDADERKAALARMRGVERRSFVQVEGFERVYAIADEDLERENDEKTSSVHFPRFELSPAMVAHARNGAAISVGMDHDAYRTFWLSLPALPAVLVTQLAFGSTYALDGRPLAPPYFWNGVVLWDQVVLGCTVAVAVIASRINFGLRRQVFEAKSVGQ